MASSNLSVSLRARAVSPGIVDGMSFSMTDVATVRTSSTAPPVGGLVPTTLGGLGSAELLIVAAGVAAGEGTGRATGVVAEAEAAEGAVGLGGGGGNRRG